MLRHPLSRFTKLHPQPWPASWLSGANRQLLTWHKDSTPDARPFLAPIQALLLPRAQGPPSGSAALRLRTTGAVACAWLGAGLSLGRADPRNAAPAHFCCPLSRCFSDRIAMPDPQNAHPAIAVPAHTYAHSSHPAARAHPMRTVHATLLESSRASGGSRRRPRLQRRGPMWATPVDRDCLAGYRITLLELNTFEEVAIPRAERDCRLCCCCYAGCFRVLRRRASLCQPLVSAFDFSL